MAGLQEFANKLNSCAGRQIVYPHPCGFLADPRHECRCTYPQIHRYRAKISGPLLDRIDIHVEVPAVPYKDLMGVAAAESSAAIARRVTAARRLQAERFKRSRNHCNAQMVSRQIKTYCRIDPAADLDNAADILAEHVSEAIQYRSLDRVRTVFS